MKARLLLGIAALVSSTVSLAQEAMPGFENPATYQTASEAAQSKTKTRAEVKADLAMWQRAGLDVLYREGSDLPELEVQRRMAEYTRLRNGPEYVAELRRLQGRQSTARFDASSNSN